MTIETIRFPVRGMVCSSCVGQIMRAVRRVKGVTSVRVDLRNETATITRDPAIASDESISAAIGAAGYEAVMAAASVVPAGDRTSGLLARLGLRRAT